MCYFSYTPAVALKQLDLVVIREVFRPRNIERRNGERGTAEMGRQPRKAV